MIPVQVDVQKVWWQTTSVRTTEAVKESPAVLPLWKMLENWESAKTVLAPPLTNNRVTANAKFYETVLKRSTAAHQRVRPQMYRHGKWSLLRKYARPHTVIRLRNFLPEYYVTVIPHPPYLPDLLTADVSLFSKDSSRANVSHIYQTSDDVCPLYFGRSQKKPSLTHLNSFIQDEWVYSGQRVLLCG